MSMKEYILPKRFSNYTSILDVICFLEHSTILDTTKYTPEEIKNTKFNIVSKMLMSLYDEWKTTYKHLNTHHHALKFICDMTLANHTKDYDNMLKVYYDYIAYIKNTIDITKPDDIVKYYGGVKRYKNADHYVVLLPKHMTDVLDHDIKVYVPYEVNLSIFDDNYDDMVKLSYTTIENLVLTEIDEDELERGLVTYLTSSYGLMYNRNSNELIRD